MCCTLSHCDKYNCPTTGQFVNIIFYYLLYLHDLSPSDTLHFETSKVLTPYLLVTQCDVDTDFRSHRRCGVCWTHLTRRPTSSLLLIHHPSARTQPGCRRGLLLVTLQSFWSVGTLSTCWLVVAGGTISSIFLLHLTLVDIAGTYPHAI